VRLGIYLSARRYGPPFVVILEPAACDSKEPSLKRKSAVLKMAAHVINHISKTAVKLDDVFAWVNANSPAEQPMEKFVCSIPISVLADISAEVLHCGSQ
jgi:hypothetical protein